MEKVGFIGAFDKSNLIMYVAKVLTYLGHRVLIIDTTVLQKVRYIAPSITPTKSYIADLEDIDIAIGFKNMTEIERYLGISETSMPYDCALIDIESYEALEQFDIENVNKNFFVTGFDLYSLRKGLSILERIQVPIKLTKVLCRYELNEEDENFFNYLSMDCKVNWGEYSIYLPYTDEDTQAIEENQRMYQIRIKKLSMNFQDGIMYIVQEILDEKNLGRIKKAIKE